ncbi:antibiotic biosynthesis monooxygenase [Thalassospira indica]|uniref:Antibiotic biosynthesis monooxygenase n=1 Tax=Thalassospira indica TaxID=1891279 RepID=A0ABM6XZE3_9PROT|nr:antibiotic biosynthesis monooxygenase [Thalassospira indica]
MQRINKQVQFDFRDYNDGFVIAIWLVAKDGEEEEVAKLLEGLVAPTMAEPDVKLFLPYRSPKDIKTFFLFELYRDEAGWQAHQETQHFLDTIRVLEPKLDKRERVPFVPFL